MVYIRLTFLLTVTSNGLRAMRLASVLLLSTMRMTRRESQRRVPRRLAGSSIGWSRRPEIDAALIDIYAGRLRGLLWYLDSIRIFEGLWYYILQLCRELYCSVRSIEKQRWKEVQYEVAALVDWEAVGWYRNTPISSPSCSGLTIGQDMLRRLSILCRWRMPWCGLSLMI